jgi:carbon storage regulator CsrA
MLVLSRRVNQKILFPSISTSLQIVSVKSGTARLAIDSPRHVPVFRGELLDQQPGWIPLPAISGLAPGTDAPVLHQVLHQLNNRLNSSTIALALLRRQFNLGLPEEMQATLAQLDEEMDSLRDAAESLGQQAGPAPRATRRALLVEDDANECELLAGFLRLAGIDVDTAGDGLDALRQLERNPRPDIVLLDMILPRCDGPTTVRAIRAEPRWAGLRIFGMTGANPHDFNLPEGPEGVDRWFPKPLKPEALLAEL